MTEGVFDIRTKKRIPDGEVWAEGFTVPHTQEDIEAALDFLHDHQEDTD